MNFEKNLKQEFRAVLWCQKLSEFSKSREQSSTVKFVQKFYPELNFF